ncbi:hypothetical protein JW916_09405 [Candidatus Sumerlaeota bacterium]|nr:hypothetical protein [Candidatus Sumerlaeota bacterium]
MAFYPTADWKKELFEIFFSRIKVIVGCTVAIFVCSIAIVLFYPRTYLASGSVLMRSKGQPVRPAVMEKDPNQRDMPVSKEDMATELEVITSSKLLEQTVQRLGLSPETPPGQDPFEYGILNQPSPDDMKATSVLGLVRLAIVKAQRDLRIAVAKPPTPYAGAVKDLRNSLDAEVVPLSSVIKVTIRGQEKRQVERVLNAMLREYIVYRGEVYSPNTQETFFRERATDYEKRVRVLETQMRDGGTSASVSVLENEILSNISIKGKLLQEIVLLRGQLAEREENVRPLEEAVQSKEVQFYSFLQNPAINYLGNHVAETVAEREKAVRGFLPESKKVRLIDENIAALNKRLRDEAATIMNQEVNGLEGAKAQIEVLQESVKSLEKVNESLRRQIVLAQRMERDLNFWLTSYQTFLKRKEEIEIDLAIRQKNFSADVSILSDAGYSAELLYPRKLATLVLGLIVGFLTGCSLGFLFEYLDHSIRRPNEVERYTGLTVIGSIRRF